MSEERSSTGRIERELGSIRAELTSIRDNMQQLLGQMERHARDDLEIHARHDQHYLELRVIAAEAATRREISGRVTARIVAIITGVVTGFVLTGAQLLVHLIGK